MTDSQGAIGDDRGQDGTQSRDKGRLQPLWEERKIMDPG